MRRAKSESRFVVGMSAVLSTVFSLGAVLMAGCTGPEAGSGAASDRHHELEADRFGLSPRCGGRPGGAR